MQDGLSYRHVKSFIKDSDGFLWMSTYGGMDRYDGVDWLHYKSLTSDSTAVPVNDVRWMFEDPAGNFILNLGVESRLEYFLFDKKEETLQQIIFQNRKQEVIIANIEKPFINKSGDIIAIDRVQEKEYLKFIYKGNGIFEAVSTIRHINLPFDSLATTTSREIHWTKSRISHNGYTYTVFELDNDVLKIYPFDRFFTNGRIPVDKNGNFWYPNPDNSKMFDSFQVPPSVPLNQWVSFRTDNYSNIWLVDRSGNLYKFDVRQKRINEKSLIMLDYISLNNFYQDEDGTLWLHGKHGIDKLLKKRNYFEQYLYDSNAKKEGYSKLNAGINVYPITETDDGKLHVLTSTNKLHSFDPNQKPVEVSTEIIGYKNGRAIVKLFSTASTMVPASGNRIWMNNSQAMYLYDQSTFEFTKYPLPESFSNLKKVSVGTWALSLEMDEDGKIWYVLFDHLIAFNSHTKEYSANVTRVFEKGIIGIGEGERWICSNTTLSKFDGDGNVI